MAVDVLGPLEVDAGPLPRRERAILATLIVRRGLPVEPGELADAAWGERPPATWRQQVKTAIAEIRARLGHDAIQTVSGAYVFTGEPASIDAVRFEELVHEARERAVRGEPDRAVDAYRRALALWRGRAFADVTQWPPGVAESSRLEQIRVSAEEELLEMRLAAGDARSVVQDAERLARAEPLREDRWAILATALYQSNRQADALNALRQAREQLDVELGIDPGPRLRALETAILRQDPLLAPPVRSEAADGACPWVGLRPFDFDDVDLFFGRAAEVATLVERVQPGAVATITGPSGSGKSSVLRAGVVAALADLGRITRVVHPDEAGIATLRAAVYGGVAVDVAAVDQLEEVLRLPSDGAESFATALRDYLDSGGAVVTTIRSDSLDAASVLPRVGPAIGREVLVLGALSPEGLRAAIEEPARRAGLRLEAGLVELLMRDAGDRPAVLPHLSHALVETWARRVGSTLTVDGYENSGGIAGSIAQSAEECYESLPAGDRPVCRAVLLRLVDRGPDGVTGRRRVPTRSLLEDAARRRVVEDLVAARLLMIDGDSIVIAHEAVASAWPRLDRWLDDDAEGMRLLRRVEADALAWDAAGRPADELLHGARLQATLDWRERAAPDLTGVERAYLDDSVALADRERQELERRAEGDRRQNRRLRWALGGAAGLLCVALVSGAIAVVRGDDARRAEDDARIEALAASAAALVSSDRDLAALIAAELHERFPDDPRGRAALFTVLSAPDSPTAKISFGAGVRLSAAVIPGTDEILAVTDDPSDGRARAEVWNGRTGERVRTLSAELPSNPTSRSGAVHIDPSARTAIVLTPAWIARREGDCCTTSVTLLDLASGLPVGPTQETRWLADSDAAFNADGSWAAVGNARSRHPIWVDLESGTPTSASAVSNEGPPGDEHLGGVATLPDGAIAVARQRGVDIYDAAARNLVRSWDRPEQVMQWSLAVDEEGMLLGSGRDGIGRIDPADGSALWVREDVDRCESIVPVPGEQSFICLGTVSWEGRLEDGMPTGRRFESHASALRRAEVSADGALVVVSDRPGSFAQRFPLDGTGPLTTRVADGRVAVDGFIDEGAIVTRLPSASYDPSVLDETVWDLEADRSIGPSAHHIDAVGRGVVARWGERYVTPPLSDVPGSRSWAIEGETITAVDLTYPVPGGPGPLSFVLYNDWIAAFDPATGQAAGSALDFAEKDLTDSFNLLSVNEIPGQERAVVTWRDRHEAQSYTGVYDLRTGEEIARGLEGDTASIPLNDGRIVSASANGLRLSSPLLQPILTAPKPIAAGAEFELSDDGRTLLLTGSGGVALYDAETLRSLGGTTTVQPDRGFAALPASGVIVGPGAYLSPSGTRMVTDLADGVLLWDLDPDRMVDAACRMVGRDFTPTEWRTYFGDAEQTPTCSGEDG